MNDKATTPPLTGAELDKPQRFNNRGGLMNPEANGLYVRYEDFVDLIAQARAQQETAAAAKVVCPGCNGIGTWIGQHDGYDDADCYMCDGAGKVAAVAPSSPDLAALIHYPECWDTAAYPTLAAALHECVATFRCSEHAAVAPSDATRKSVGLPQQLPDDALRYVMECAGMNNPDGARRIKSIYLFLRDALMHPADATGKADALAIELQGVRDEMAAGSGFWSSCSGCYDTEDGHPTGNYSYSAVFRCALGSGCSECGGIGAVWDNTDYEAMAASWHKDDQSNATSAADAKDGGNKTQSAPNSAPTVACAQGQRAPAGNAAGLCDEEMWNFAMRKAADACRRYAAAGMDAENIASMIQSLGYLVAPNAAPAEKAGGLSADERTTAYHQGYQAGIQMGKALAADEADADRSPAADAGGQKPIGYLPAYELGRLESGHDARLRSAKFGPSALDGDVPVYARPAAVAGDVKGGA